MFGMPSNTTPLPRQGDKPEDREWPGEARYYGFKPSCLTQEPTPPATPPIIPDSKDQPTYPQAKTYYFNTEYDARYLSGYYLSNDFHTSERESLKKRLLHVQMPPSAAPHFNSVSQAWETTPLEGMIKMIVGVPYQQRIDGNPLRAVTVGCAHTPDSLQQILKDPSITDDCNFLYEQIFGKPPTAEDPGFVPLCELPGLKPNDRSTGFNPQFPYDASVNLGTTVVKGQGVGKTAPAITVAGDEAVERVAAVNVKIHSVTRAALRASLMKEEYDAIEFNSIDNNIFALGGLEPANTSAQLNSSSDREGGVLNGIGQKQGKWHNDVGDDPARWTVFVLMFDLAEGKCLIFFF